MVEDIGLSDLEATNAYNVVFERLDLGFKYDAMTEFPDDFETFFIKLHRKHGQTLQDYQVEFTKVERKLEATHSVKLPEKVRAWWFLRRSGVSREQRQLILTHVGAENLDVDKVQKAMNFILGQDSKPDGKVPYTAGRMCTTCPSPTSTMTRRVTGTT